MTAQDIHALSGAYAVDALDDLERIRFEEHLAACADCRDEVASLRDTTWMLGGLTDTAPSPELRDRLLAGIKEIRPLPPETAPKHRAIETPEPSDALPGRRRFGWRTFAAAAAVLAVVGTGTVTAVELLRDDSSQTMTTAERVLNAKDATTVAIDLPGDARARVVRSVSENRAVLVTSDMPAAPTGKVYELWLQHDDVMVPAGVMPAGSDQTFVLKGDASGTQARPGSPSSPREAPTNPPRPRSLCSTSRRPRDLREVGAVGAAAVLVIDGLGVRTGPGRSRKRVRRPSDAHEPARIRGRAARAGRRQRRRDAGMPRGPWSRRRGPRLVPRARVGARASGARRGRRQWARA